jgi:hypothetical protein
MSSKINHVTFDCADTYVQARFWSQVLHRPMHPDDHPGDPAVGVRNGPSSDGIVPASLRCA